jgi:hypothetical protein
MPEMGLILVETSEDDASGRSVAATVLYFLFKEAKMFIVVSVVACKGGAVTGSNNIR